MSLQARLDHVLAETRRVLPGTRALLLNRATCAALEEECRAAGTLTQLKTQPGDPQLSAWADPTSGELIPLRSSQEVEEAEVGILFTLPADAEHAEGGATAESIEGNESSE